MLSTSAQRLILGTAQLGMPYGIANRTGRPDDEAAGRIVAAAHAGGIRSFDTAKAYGECEEVLGAAFRKLGITEQCQVIDKLPPDLSGADAPRIPAMVRESSALLGVSSLACLMLHREEHLPLMDGPVGDVLHTSRNAGLVRKLGVSVYTPQAASAALDHPLIDIVQLPASLFDRRFESAGIFAYAARRGKSVHIRSALLQGVLCLTPQTLPPHLSALAPALEAFAECCAEYGVPPGPCALLWILRRHPEASVLFGAETEKQVTHNLDFLSRNDSFGNGFWSSLDTVYPPQYVNVLNPSLWSLSP